MPVLSAQDVLNWLGLSSLNPLAEDCLKRAEQHVCDFLGWEAICQQTWTDFLPLEQGMTTVNDPIYVVNSAHTRATPANYYSQNTLQLRHIPVRCPLSGQSSPAVPVVSENWTAFFGQMPPGFIPADQLEYGVDYFIRTEEPGISWSGQLVRRTFWFPSMPGSVQAVYTAGFSDAELTGRYSCFKTACLETLADLYLRAKAVAGGQFPDISSDGLGGGATTTYVEQVLNVEIPDAAARRLQRYRYEGEIAL